MKFLKRFWNAMRRPSARYASGTLVIGGILAGILLWGGFNTAMEATNTMAFCTSCHEMRDYVYEEYKETVHYANDSGVRATCSDCHVPDPWVHKVRRKIVASAEVWHKLRGTINTPEKFEARRLLLAERVWDSMQRTDSRECRNCHEWDAMDLEAQPLRAQRQHAEAIEANETCIDCHQGIAHQMPKMPQEEQDEGEVDFTF
ncbi:NapC/NirT family cytochrome c [Thioalkalivibrio thiocyanodenitrificans]|uniref:NapC/NirT family cytochrome c n=1 Tax=Thioalkalivibrio thiocyanodenitrificans TaxID=243063 RepID=UPI0003645064|nr:NapC/NirT family cytochrome c [Thioalkalivibrio thiocyanodenitrificans]